MSAPRSALILGGGLAGLTCAHELAQKGVPVTVLEKLPAVGGLARNVTHRDAGFDLGGHRFFSADPRLIQWLHDLAGDELLQVPRKSRILMGGKFFDYPLRTANAIAGFGLQDTYRILADYTEAAFRRALSSDADISFADWVLHRFGRRLYDLYFRPYTEKVWGMPCEQISADWAAQRIQLLSLTDAVWQAVRPGRNAPKTYAQDFWYPKSGIGILGERLAQRVRDLGGVIHTGRAVERITRRGSRVTSVTAGGEKFNADIVISTLPLNLLGKMIGAPADAVSALRYRAIRCVYLLLDTEQVTDDTWLYFPEADIVFGRSHEPPNWSRQLAPAQGTSLCLEVFCHQGDEQWSRPENELADACVADLDRLGLVKPAQVADAFSVQVPDAYPVFHVGYKKPLRAVTESIDRIDNLFPLGRTGAYLYHNMDQVVEAAIALARKVVGT